MTLSPEQEYWNCVCEKDQAWIDYCKHPSDDMWKFYVDACEAEKKAELAWANEIGL
jgi:hypothetical protein